MIKLNDICKKYENKYVKTEVLDNVNLTVEDRSIIAITGASGSGKSTLLNIMCGLDKPTSGSVFHNGIDISNMKENKLTKFRLDNFGFVFQDFQLISTLNVRDNIILPQIAKSKQVDEDWYEKILEMVELEGKQCSFPHQLSGGEKQRVAIARAIVTMPNVLFADEPTGNLDDTNTKRIMDFMIDYSNKYKCTLIYVTHEIGLCEKANIVLTIKDKEIDIVSKVID